MLVTQYNKSMRKRLIPALLVAVLMLSGYGMFSAYLRSQDTSFSGYLSGLMLNFWGGTSDQLIRVNLYNHSIALYEHGQLYKFARIAATGNPDNSTATPTGKFRILSKDRRHVSGLSGVIMPLSMRFYEGYYFHDIPLTPQGAVIDTKYSHGCIRLPTALAQEMFAWTKVGAYVEIYDTSLVRADDNTPTVYLLTADGYKHPFASAQAFLSRGYQWPRVAVIPAVEIASMPLGGTLQ